MVILLTSLFNMYDLVQNSGSKLKFDIKNSIASLGSTTIYNDIFELS